MLHISNDPDPDKKITNSDEQDVAVNHSTKEEGGYDEPSPEASRSHETNDDLRKAEDRRSEEKKNEKNDRGQSFRSGKIN